MMKKKWIFLPVALLYGVVVAFRNFLFTVKILKKYKPPMFTVSVGNIQVGGTGKTPHVEYLVNLFRSEKIAVLSRGYGRQTKGFVQANEFSTADTLGDEPYQIYQKFKEKIGVFVSENRPKGVLKILQQDTPKVLLLDDSYQHQFIDRHVNLLLTTYDYPFTQDQLLPVGNLREYRSGVDRADAIVVTKSPDKEKRHVNYLIKSNLYQTGKPVFFSTFKYGTPVGYAMQCFEAAEKVVLISGIGIPEVFENYGALTFIVDKKIRFPDHHKYTREELYKICEHHGNIQFLTTEKDFVKIKPLLDELTQSRFFYLPIEVSFDDSVAFNSFILERFKKYQSS